MTTSTLTSFHPTLKYTPKLPRSTLAFITTRNEVVLLGEAGTGSVADVIVGYFPASPWKLLFLWEPLFAFSSSCPLYALEYLHLSDSHHWPLPQHSHPIPPHLPVFQPLLCPLSHWRSCSIRPVWHRRRKVWKEWLGEEDETFLTDNMIEVVVLLATPFTFPRALMQYMVVIWFYTVNYVIYLYVN